MSHFNALALRPRTTRALAIALAVLTWAVLAIVMAQPASAISSKKADAKAMKILKTKSKKEVVLFRDKRLLRPSDRVTFATRDRVPVGKKRYKKLGRAAWLYWQDMAPYARFEHPSEMLLLDKKTGKVLSRKKLTYYPLVNGKRPAYLRSTKAYANKRYRVYERLAAPAVTVDLSQLATTSQALPSVLDEPEYRSLLGAKVAGLPTSPDLPATAFQNDCVLMLGELHDDQARRDFTAIAQFGARAGIRTYYATKKGVDPSTSRPAHNRASEGSTASLTEDMRYLVDEQKCLDVMIYASGHGSPASGRGSTKRAIVTMTGPITTRRGKRQETKRRLTSTTLKQVVAAFPTTTFKFKIDACFSGRFTTELANSDGDLPPNNLVIETSSAANQVSYFGFEAQWAQIADSVVRENANELRAAIEERGRAMVVADVADLLRGELGRSVPNTNRISEFTHGNIAGMTSYIATRPAGQTLIGGSELATMINESKTLGADADQAARLGWTTRQSRVNPNPLPPVTAVDRCAAGFGWRGGDPSTQIGEFTLTCGGISPLTMVDIIGSAPLLNFDPHPGLIPNCTLVGNGINCTGSAPPEGPVALSVFPASPGQSFNVGAGFGDGHAESWLLTLP